MKKHYRGSLPQVIYKAQKKGFILNAYSELMKLHVRNDFGTICRFVVFFEKNKAFFYSFNDIDLKQHHIQMVVVSKEDIKFIQVAKQNNFRFERLFQEVSDEVLYLRNKVSEIQAELNYKTIPYKRRIKLTKRKHRLEERIAIYTGHSILESNLYKGETLYGLISDFILFEQEIKKSLL